MGDIRNILATAIPEEQADRIMVEQLGAAMLEKLAKKRGEGRGGWLSGDCDRQIGESLVEHLRKGDMVDVANLAGMLHVRRALYSGMELPKIEEAPTPATEPPINLAGAGVDLVKIAAADGKLKKLRADAKDWNCVLDQCTGLLFPAELPDTRYTWKDALKAPKSMKLGGFRDWRLAPRKAALSITDDTRFEPAVNTKFFRYPKSDWVWTSTASASNPEISAWGVNLLNGGSNRDHQDSKGLLLAVRGPVSAPGQ